jgi:hypothetical protein
MTTKVFEAALGIAAPWSVASVVLRPALISSRSPTPFEAER